jgi:hypothetical protein
MRQVIYWPIPEKSRNFSHSVLRVFSLFSQGFPQGRDGGGNVEKQGRTGFLGRGTAILVDFSSIL